MNLQLITIIIPVYNRAVLIAETLRVVLEQTYANWECLVVDDGSSDGTQAVVQRFNNLDARIKLLSRPDIMEKGAPSCRNYGLENAKGTIVWFFDSDDIMTPNALENRLTCVNAFPDLDFWVFQTQRFYETVGDNLAIWNDLSKVNDFDLIDFLRLNPIWHTSGPLWKRSFLEEHGLRYQEGILSWQDWEFHLRVLLYHPDYKKFPNLDVGVYQRFHSHEAINKRNDEVVIYNRLDTIYNLLEEFKSKGLLGQEQQHLFARLIYFLIRQLPIHVSILSYWSRFTPFFKDLSTIDLVFWKYFLHLQRQQTRLGYYTFYRVMKTLKKMYFSKRLLIDKLDKRTWYKLHLN